MKPFLNRAIAAVMVILMLFVSFPVTELENSGWSALFANIFTASSRAADSIQCGNNVYCSYNNDTAELTISGTGDMWNFEDRELPYDVEKNKKRCYLRGRNKHRRLCICRL